MVVGARYACVRKEGSMREALYVAAAFIGIAGAIITLLPLPRLYRRFRHRRGLMRAFLHAAVDGQLRATFRREKEIFGDGFVDGFGGTAGMLRFRLTRRFRPFCDIDTYSLELGHGAAEDASGREWYGFELKTPEEGEHPLVGAYRNLRKRYPMGDRISEAS